jgi:quercetin dioxygenase-like cupin family protein
VHRLGGSDAGVRGPVAKADSQVGQGQTGKIRAGEWIVEQPSTIHRVRNGVRAPVIVLLATLFTNGSTAGATGK